MKTILLSLAFLAGVAISCSAPKTDKSNTENVSTESVEIRKDHVEVLYFHGKQRCITCNAIEQLTKETLESDFAEQLADGSLTFRIIDISEPDNEAIADKYEVSWSSLFVNKWKDAQEISENMTDFGFSYAKSSPEEFKRGLKEKLSILLNQ